VAPLKLLLRGVKRSRFWRFPRLQKRGPIEAYPLNLSHHPQHQFPRLQKRGPIEALSQRRTDTGGCLVSTLTKAWPH